MSILNFKLYQESVSDVRKYLAKEPNFSEKGKEMDSGGKLDNALSNILIAILSQIDKEIPGMKVTVTAGNDSYHSKLGVNSKHKQGKAVDFVISPAGASDIEKVKSILDRFASGNKGFSYLDEYTRPSKYSTGKHFHISFDPQKPEGSHARKIKSGQTPINIGKGLDVFDFGSKSRKRYGSDIPIDTWAGFIQRIERES
jgi:hypothetical protein